MRVEDRIGRGLLRDLVRRGGEDGLVEHLAALLRVPELGRAFMEVVLGLEVPDDELLVETQVHDPATRARPDLVLRTSRATVWIEAKLDAALTDKQPSVYIDALHDLGSGDGRLFVLAKSARWGELARSLRSRVGHPPGDGRTFIHRGVPVTQVTWREARGCFAAIELDEPVASYLVAEFIETIDLHVERLAVPFTEEARAVVMNPDVLQAWAALEDVMLDLWEALSASGHGTRKQEADDLRQTGFYAWPEGDEDRMVWVGLISRAGAAWPGTGPAWVWLCGDAYEGGAELRAAGVEVVDSEAVALRLPDWADCPLVPLGLEGGSAGQVVDALRRQLKVIWGSNG